MSGLILLALRLALVIFLYAFLGYAFLLIWKDLRANALGSPSSLKNRLTLQTSSDDTPQVFTQQEVRLGRDPGCDCILDDPTISAWHARLYFSQGHWWVEDLHSTNGTFINQEPVTIPMVISTGDLLQLGKATLKISLSGE